VDQESALSFALFYHALHLVPTVAAGSLVWLARGGGR